MENIYGQNELTRNAIVSLPDGFAENAGNALYSWLGSLWRGLHKGDGMVRGLQSARGIRLAQMYVDILEAVNLKDRNGAPVFHRDLWHPIVIRKSKRDKSQENMLSLGGDDRKIGPQPPGSEYGEGTVFKMGRMANYEHFFTYPIDAKITGGALTIVDNIVNPTVILEKGVDYEIRNNSIIFRKENDPITTDSAFDCYDLPEMIEDELGNLSPDIETVLWASDVLIDKDYISSHVSYALGANAPSTDVVKRILNAAWSSVSSGLTPELVKTLLASMLNIPVIQNEHETVTDITREEDAEGNLVAQVVQTDSGTYRISPKARMISSIQIGSVLSRGDLLDETVRIYSYLNVASCYDTKYSVPIEQDVPSVVLSPSLIRVKTEYGVYAMWERSIIRTDPDLPLDANGNPRLYFDIGGSEEDVSAFWSDIWERAEKEQVDLREIMGEEGTLISPASFFLRHLVGANTLFVVVDKSQADDVSMMRNPMFFDMLSDVVPSAIRLFLVEHNTVGEDDRMDLDQAKESSFLAAALPEIVECVSERMRPGAGRKEPSFGEGVSMKFVRPSPVKIRGKKEEEK